MDKLDSLIKNGNYVSTTKTSKDKKNNTNINTNTNTVINTNINKGSSKTNNTNTNKGREVETKARLLMEKLGATEVSLDFFCMVYWSLPESKIQQFAEVSVRKGRNPSAYFNSLSMREINKLRR